MGVNNPSPLSWAFPFQSLAGTSQPLRSGNKIDGPPGREPDWPGLSEALPHASLHGEWATLGTLPGQMGKLGEGTPLSPISCHVGSPLEALSQASVGGTLSIWSPTEETVAGAQVDGSDHEELRNLQAQPKRSPSET